MESCKTLLALLDNTRKSDLVADKFVKERRKAEEKKCELVRLLFQSVGVKTKIDEKIIKRSSVADLADHLAEAAKRAEAADVEIPLQDKLFFEKCVSFFERLFVIKWNTFAFDESFKKTYYLKLLEALSESCLPLIYTLCFKIQLKVVTAYISNAHIQHEQEYNLKVLEYAKRLAAKSIFYISVQCSIFGCSEVYLWIRLAPEIFLATNDFLRVIVWNFYTDKPTQFAEAAKISCSLIRRTEWRESLKLFVSQLVRVFEEVGLSENLTIFQWVCECSSAICEYDFDAISPKLFDVLFDTLFAQNPAPAKHAAKFWCDGIFARHSHADNIRTILSLLQGRASQVWKVLVDSFVDTYALMTDFKLQVSMIMNDESLPEENRLSMYERERLLRLMLYAVERSISGNPPALRRQYTMTYKPSTSPHSHSCRATQAILPRFWALFHLPFEKAEVAQISLVSMMKYLNYYSMERTAMKDFVNQCVVIFGGIRQARCYQVVLDVLRIIRYSFVQNVVNKAQINLMRKFCDDVFLLFKGFCETLFAELVNDIVDHPAKYENLNSEPVKEAEAIWVRTLAVIRVVTLRKTCSVEAAGKLLKQQILPHNQIRLCMMYVCVGLLCDYVCFALREVREICDEAMHQPTEYADTMHDLRFLVKLSSVKLYEWYPWSDLTVTLFINLCKVLHEAKTLRLPESAWYALLPPDARYVIAGYVAQMVWKSNDATIEVPLPTKTRILAAFLRLVENRVLPLFYAYDVMTSLPTAFAVVEKPLREFIKKVVRDVEEESTVVDWLTNWITCLFQLSPTDCLDAVENFVASIYPIKADLQNIIHRVGEKSIDFVLSDDAEQSDDASAASRHQFLDVIVKLSKCLEGQRRHDISNYFKRAKTKRTRGSVAKDFLNRLLRFSTRRKSKKPATSRKSIASASTGCAASKASDKSKTVAEPTEGLEPIASTSRGTPEKADASKTGAKPKRNIIAIIRRGTLENSDKLYKMLQMKKMSLPSLADVDRSKLPDNQHPRLRRSYSMLADDNDDASRFVQMPMRDFKTFLNEILAASQARAPAEDSTSSEEKTRRKMDDVSGLVKNLQQDLVNEMEKVEYGWSSDDDDESSRRTESTSVTTSGDSRSSRSKKRKASSKCLEGGITKVRTSKFELPVPLRRPLAEASPWPDEVEDIFRYTSPDFSNATSPNISPVTKRRKAEVEDMFQMYDDVVGFARTMRDDNSCAAESMEPSPAKSSPRAARVATRAAAESTSGKTNQNLLPPIPLIVIEGTPVRNIGWPTPMSVEDCGVSYYTSPEVSSLELGSEHGSELGSELGSEFGSPSLSPEAKKRGTAEASNATAVMETSPAKSSPRATRISNLIAADPTSRSCASELSDFSPQTKPDASQGGNVCPAYDDIKQLPLKLDARKLSDSLSYGSDSFRDERLAPPISYSDSLVADPIARGGASESPLFSPRAEQGNGQVGSASRRMYENIEKFVRGLTAEHSSASASSGDDEIMKKNLLRANLMDDTCPAKRSPAAADGNSSQAESTTSQMYDNAIKFVSSLDAEKSSASSSSGDKEFMKRRLNTSMSDTDSFAVSPAGYSRIGESSTSSPVRDTTAIASTSQEYDIMRKFVEKLRAEEDLINSSLFDMTLTRPTQGAIEDSQDLYNILASDSERQSDGSDGASRRVDDVAENLQRVSLSNEESDEIDPSLCFAVPPTKKRRSL